MTARDDMRARYEAGLHLIPKHMREGVTAHIEHGRDVGSFLTAMLEGDYDFARRKADSTNMASWRGWMDFLEAYAPEASNGTKEKAAAWKAHQGMENLP